MSSEQLDDDEPASSRCYVRHYEEDRNISTHSTSSSSETSEHNTEGLDERPVERRRRNKLHTEINGPSSSGSSGRYNPKDFERETEYDWLFDYLYTVFKAPSWEGPLQSFIDEKCIVFDNDDENKLAYTEIHEEFRKFVESLLETHLEQIGISPEDFVEICQKCMYPYHHVCLMSIGLSPFLYNATATSPGCRHLNQLVLDKIVAMDDFEVFKRMMQRRNMELEAQALRELREMGNKVILSDNATRENDHDNSGTDDQKTLPQAASQMNMNEMQETADLEAALANSLLEFDQQRAEAEIEMADLEQAIRESLKIDKDRLQSLQKRMEKEDVDENERMKIHQQIKETQENIEQAHAAIEEHQQELKSMHQKTTSTTTTQMQTDTAQGSSRQDTEALMRERAEHLKRQRDILRQRRRASQASDNVTHVVPPPPEKDIQATVAAIKQRDHEPEETSAYAHGKSRPHKPLAGPDKEDRFRKALAASAKQHLSEQSTQGGKSKQGASHGGGAGSVHEYANNLQQARERRQESQDSVAKRLAELSAARAKRMRETAPDDEDDS